MHSTDILRAALLGVIVLLGTLVASVPMVAFYAYLIDPGQPQVVYEAAAQSIAPWSSHVVGPLLFLWLNYRGAVRAPSRPAIAFALVGVVCYFAADMATVPLFGLSFSNVLTMTFFISLSAKTAGALVGARLGQLRAHTNAGMRAEEERTDG